MKWIEFKLYIAQVANLHQDALHIYAAVLIQIGAAILVRRPLSSFLPWLFVLAFLLVNEAIDLWEPRAPIEEWQVIGGLKDLWNTLALPTVLLLLTRYAPWLFARSTKQAIPSSSRPLA